MTKVQRLHPNWLKEAACGGNKEEPELFFPVGNTGPALLQIEEAKAVCRRCPAIGHCALFALENGEDSGVWGGMSEAERRELRLQHTRSKVGFLFVAQGIHEEFDQRHPVSKKLPPIFEYIEDEEPSSPSPAPMSTLDPSLLV